MPSVKFDEMLQVGLVYNKLTSRLGCITLFYYFKNVKSRRKKKKKKKKQQSEVSQESVWTKEIVGRAASWPGEAAFMSIRLSGVRAC